MQNYSKSLKVLLFSFKGLFLELANGAGQALRN